MKKIVEMDSLLMPYKEKLDARYTYFEGVKKKLLHGAVGLSEFANGYLYYGFHKWKDGWVFREWAPGAEQMFLIGDFNGWNRQSHPMMEIKKGVWEIYLKEEDLIHGSKVKIHIRRHGQCFDRIPSYIKRVEQNADNSFNGVFWDPEPFKWEDCPLNPGLSEPLLIYECHVGMCGEEKKIHSFRYFTKYILPEIKKSGYNAIQLMGIMGHPYYASFGYQVTNFFAVAHWFGTPEDLKALVQAAHSMGIAVLLDLVHGHAASNTLEGLAAFDGAQEQYFHEGAKGNHPQWGSKVFDYGKKEVLHFLLSNIKFWLAEYHFDGFRFDGVTSMLYHSHGVDRAFDGYGDYFGGDTDKDGVAYLQLATATARTVKKDVVLIAEEVSGMPGLCLPIPWGGFGFDYRLRMGLPDYWVYLLEKVKDEDWDLGVLWHELTAARPGEKTIGYVECHDQAMVGDKTIMHRLAGAMIYTHMALDKAHGHINRAMALHKMLRLITALCGGEGYLNFMGNEFGHPEWIDFPRAGNGYSYDFARRQWHLAEDESLQYCFLQRFDQAMIQLAKESFQYSNKPVLVLHDQAKMFLIVRRGPFLMVFHFHPTMSHSVTVHLDGTVTLTERLQTEDTPYGGRKERKVSALQQDGTVTFYAAARTAAVWRILNE